MDKRFLLILAALVVIFGGIFWFTKSNSSAPGSNGGDTPDGTNHVLGDNTAGVTLVEFGDYQCPACYQYYPLLKQVQEKYNDQIAFQFRNFPLVQIHPNAMMAARAAEAAAQQDKFWEMHDLLFENQASWSELQNPQPTFIQYANQLGLDIGKFEADMGSSAILAAINADVAAAQSYGGTGTPLFILNGERIESPSTLEGFSELIDQAIAEAENNQ